MMPYPVIPEALQVKIDEAARAYLFFFHTQQYYEAQQTASDLLDKMLAYQEKTHERLHKGWPLHNIGNALLLQGRTEDAFRFFILAYVEDIPSADNPDEADSTPAGQTLLLSYGIKSELLRILKDRSIKLKSEGKMPMMPEELLNQTEEAKWYQVAQINGLVIKPRVLRKFTIFSEDSPWDKRVFIGGSAGLSPTMETMRDVVQKLKYDPVMADDFDMPDGMTIYQKCLTLLHCCRYAIFDLSEQAGQLMEVERAPDYGVKTLVIWPRNKESSITQMLKSCLQDRRISHKAYASFAEFESIFREFLQGEIQHT